MKRWTSIVVAQWYDLLPMGRSMQPSDGWPFDSFTFEKTEKIVIQPESSNRTQSTRAPEEETRRYRETSAHLLDDRSKKSHSFSALVLWSSVVLRFNFSVLSEEISARTKGKKAGEVLNHRGHRGHRKRHTDFPLCPLCPLWLDFSDRSLRLGSGYAGLCSIHRSFIDGQRIGFIKH